MRALFPVFVLFLLLDFQIFTDSVVLRIIPSLYFSIFLFLYSQIKSVKITKELWLVVFVVLMVLSGVFLTKRSDVSFQLKSFKALELLAFFGAFLTYLSIELKYKDWYSVFFKTLYFPFFIFVSLNLFLFFLGFRGSDINIGKAVILSYFGVSLDRAQFILSSGINSYGVVLGLLLCFSFCGLFFKGRYLYIFLGGILISTVSLLLTDSRGPIIYSICSFLAMYLSRYQISSPKWLWSIPFIGIFGPILLLSILQFLATTEFADVISRSSGDLESGNARSIIWTLSLSEFSEFKINHLFGYGEYGHYAAGLSQQWGYIFGRFEGADLMHPHNTLISVALDYGYIGLVLFLLLQILLLVIIKTYWSFFRIESLFILSGLLYYNLVGIGETLFGFYYSNIMYLYLMFVSFGLIFGYKFRNYLVE